MTLEPVDGPPALNPAQERALAALRTRGVERPSFPAELADELRTHLDDALTDVVADLEEPLWVGKWALSQVHGCEVRFLHQDGQSLTPNPALLAGTLAHRAIQLSVTWRGEANPLVLVDAAVERLESDSGRDAQWLREATEAEHAEAMGVAADRVGKFLECFPPLSRRWAPATESPVRTQLVGGAIVLTGRVDLVLGRSEGLVAGKAFIDFKSGVPYGSHVDDLRFYALIETLRLGVPPFRLASYYLDGATLHCEDVTIDMLDAASQRLLDGVVKLVELRSGGTEPQPRVGPGCFRCPVLESCAPGQAHTEADDTFR